MPAGGGQEPENGSSGTRRRSDTPWEWAWLPKMIFMARKLVSGTGKSCGAGPRVLTSPPSLPHAFACLAGQRFSAAGVLFWKRRKYARRRAVATFPMPSLAALLVATARGGAPRAVARPRSSSPQPGRAPRRLGFRTPRCKAWPWCHHRAPGRGATPSAQGPRPSHHALGPCPWWLVRSPRGSWQCSPA